MKYIMAIMFAVFGFILLFAPEVIKNTNALISALCFGLASVLMNYVKEK